MAAVNGTEAAIYYGGDIEDGTQFPNIISFSIPDSRTRIDVTAAGNNGLPTFILGLKPGEVTADCYLDTSDATVEAAITSSYTLDDVHFYVGGVEVWAMDYAYISRSINTSGPNAAAKATVTFANAPASVQAGS